MDAAKAAPPLTREEQELKDLDEAQVVLYFSIYTSTCHVLKSEHQEHSFLYFKVIFTVEIISHFKLLS